VVILRILLTGATGFIGKRLLERLNELGHEVYTLVRYVSGGRYNFYSKNIVYADLRDGDAVRKAVLEVKPEIVIHLAALTAVSFSFLNPTDVFHTNTIGTIHLAEAAKEVGVKQFVHSSTSEVYGIQRDFPIKEDAILNPTSPYAVSKIAAENYLWLMYKIYNFPITIMRPFNSILEGEEVLIFNAGNPKIVNIEEIKEIKNISLPTYDEVGNYQESVPTKLIVHYYDGDAYEISVLGRRVKVTGDHSVFTIKNNKLVPIFARELKRNNYVALAKYIQIPPNDKLLIKIPEMVSDPTKYSVLIKGKHKIYSIPLSDLGRENVPKDAEIRTRHSTSKMPAMIRVSNDILWLFGLFTAEGNANIYRNSNARICFTSHLKHLEKAKEILQKEFKINAHIRYSKGRFAPTLYFNNKIFYEMLVNLELTGYAREKKIPTWVLTLPKDRLKYYLKGLWDGDGTKLQKGFQISTSSKKLVKTLQLALLRFGYYPCVQHIKNTLKGKEYFSFRVTCWGIPPNPFEWKEDQTLNPNKQTKIINDIVLGKVKSIKKFHYSGKVYDFQVPGNENFLAGDFVLCHNSFSRANVQNRHYVVERAITGALENGVINLHNPKPIREFIFRDDHVEAYIKALGNEKAIGQAFNVCYGVGYTIEEMANKVAEIVEQKFGKKVKVEFKREPDRPLDIPKLVGDPTKIKEVLGWRPKFDLEKGLIKAIDEWNSVLKGGKFE
jgi:nucleoside-diphosphate-sugar epimerase/intein/homing endonuclease